MKLAKRLDKLETTGQRIEPVFLPLDHSADSLDYFGVRGGRRFDRHTNESGIEFKQRCVAYAKQHHERGQMQIFIDVNL